MRITIGLILALSLMALLVWRPPAGAQIKRPTPTPTPKPRTPKAMPTPTPAPTPSVEKAVWNTIKNSADPAMFDRFLEDYPNGEFAAEARARRTELRRPKPASTPTPTPTPTPIVAGAIRTFDFETVRLDKNGKEVERRKLQARYFAEDLGNGVQLEMVEIPGGRFQMGSPSSEVSRDKNEGPQHPVNVLSFWMGKFEVTQAQWQAVMGNNPSYFKGDGNLPVETVSWNDAQEFLKKLNARPKLNGNTRRAQGQQRHSLSAKRSRRRLSITTAETLMRMHRRGSTAERPYRLAVSA